jgi:hypothetical protein
MSAAAEQERLKKMILELDRLRDQPEEEEEETRDERPSRQQHAPRSRMHDKWEARLRPQETHPLSRAWGDDDEAIPQMRALSLRDHSVVTKGPKLEEVEQKYPIPIVKKELVVVPVSADRLITVPAPPAEAYETLVQRLQSAHTPTPATQAAAAAAAPTGALGHANNFIVSAKMNLADAKKPLKATSLQRLVRMADTAPGTFLRHLTRRLDLLDSTSPKQVELRHRVQSELLVFYPVLGRPSMKAYFAAHPQLQKQVYGRIEKA